MDSDLIADAQQEVSPAADLPPGTIVGEQFEIISFIGQGATSHVWKARHRFLDRFVAIKMLKRHFDATSEDYKRIRNEAVSLKELSHPNIPKVHGLGEWNGRFYLAMDYVEGRTLQDELALHAPLSLDRSLKIAAQCLEALGDAHAHGIMHRDIKPGNVMLTRAADGSDIVKLLDFGIAKMFETSKQGDTTTSTQLIEGSPYYMSPEQCSGRKLDQRTDIYSMGCVLHEMITGKPPFMAETAVATMMMHLSSTFPLFSRTLNVPSAVQVAILRAVAKNREERLRTTAEFIDALNDTGSGVIAPPTRQPAKRGVRQGWLIAGSVALFAGGCLFTSLMQSTDSSQDSYKQLKSELASGRTTAQLEIARINALADHNRGAREYKDLLDAAAVVDDQPNHPLRSEVVIAAATYLRQVAPGDDRLDLRTKVDHCLNLFAADAANSELPPAVSAFARRTMLVGFAKLEIAEHKARSVTRGREVASVGCQRRDIGDQSGALELLNLAIEWAQAVKSPAAVAEAYLFRASYFEEQEQRQLADQDFATAMLAAPPGSTIQAKILLVKAQTAAARGDGTGAKRFLSEGLSVLKTAPKVDQILLMDCYAAGAATARQTGEPESAIAMWQESLRSQAIRPINPEYLIGTYRALAEEYWGKRDLPSALNTWDKAVVDLRKYFPTNYIKQTAIAQTYKADMLRSQGKSAETLPMALSALKTLHSTQPQNYHMLCEAHTIVAALQSNTGQTAAAKTNFATALSYAAQVKDLTLRDGLWRQLERRAHECGQLQVAADVCRLALSKPRKNQGLQLAFNLDLSDALTTSGKLDEARKHLLVMETEALKHPADTRTLSTLEHKLAELEYKSTNYAQGAVRMRKSIDYHGKQARDAILCDQLSFLAVNLFKAKRYAEADATISEASAIADAFPRGAQMSEAQLWAQVRLAQYFCLPHNFKRAVAIFDRIKPCFFIPFFKEPIKQHGLSYAAMLKELGRSADAAKLERYFGKTGKVRET